VKLEGPSTSQEPPFESKAYENEEWVQVYQQLKLDIADAFDKMSPTNLLSPEATQQEKSSRGMRARAKPQLLRHRLQITVRKPNQAHFSIVDIPGFVSSKYLFRI
jgi:hypothetical protein